MMDIKEVLLVWFIKLLIKNLQVSWVNNKIKQNEELAKELDKPIIRKFLKRRVYSSFKDNIWGADLAEIQLISTFNKGIRFLLCAIDIFSKYGWIVPLKDKKCGTIVNALQKILYSLMKLHLKGKPNKICVDKGSAFYNNSFKKWLKEDDIKMYSTQNERKFVAAERFIRTLKNKI